jgi:SIR2-like domain
MTSSPEDLRVTCNEIVKSMMKGTLMPFFGAGVNLTNRPDDDHHHFTYVPGGPYLPNASELSEELQREFNIKLPNPCEFKDPLSRCKWKEQSLVRVSWVVSKERGRSDLKSHLNGLFTTGEPSDVHKFFARFRQRLAGKGYKVPQQLIVTTNYDGLLERAFDEAGEPYDVFSYTVDRDRKPGEFSHTPHGAPEASPVKNPRTFNHDSEHAIIVKIHGTVHPEDWQKSTFVITEDDYIDYAAFLRFDKIPAMLGAKMLRRRFLYLGYSLSDWNFRVFLRVIKERSSYPDDPTWAIMHKLDEWDRVYWRKHDVTILETPLKEYIKTLNEAVDAMPNR